MGSWGQTLTFPLSVLDATSGKPGNEMGIRLDKLTSNGFVLIANGSTDSDGRCNNLLPGGSKPEVGIYKITFFSNDCTFGTPGDCVVSKAVTGL